MDACFKIYCVNLGREIDARGGETLADVLARIRHEIPFTAICARVNNKTESLLYPLYGPKQVEFVDINSESGQRVYTRSLCMMLYKALTKVAPGARLRICHSIARGYYCRIDHTDLEPSQQLLDSLMAEMRALVAADIPFERHEELTDAVIERFAGQELPDKVRLLKSLHRLYTVFYTLGDTADSYNSCLAPSTAIINVFNLVLYKQGFLLMPPDASATKAAAPVAQEKMYKAFTEYLDFNNIIGVTNAGELNDAVQAGRSSMIINVAEALHEKKIANISDAITQRFHQGGARIVMISGPSSSGKTTFTKRLAIQLMTNLLRPQMISLDNYFIDREHTPRDENGDYDYESLYALDIQSFNDDLNRLLDGQTVALPTYCFEKGKREYHGNTISLDHNTVLLIEGIHGLNPELTSSIAEQMKYRIYVSALTTIAIDEHNWVSTTDNRLLRRIIRDYKYRGCSPAETIRRWPSVRRGEERWIFPYQENADAMFNSSLLFEMSVMRREAEQALSTVQRDHPEYCEANRLKQFLSYFAPIDPALIPHTSLLREFVGGSSFHY